jgi:hypothetical protein
MKRTTLTPSLTACAALICTAALSTTLLAQRQLHWDAIDVTARLDNTGRLSVDETQVFVFDGDWNGGERSFDIRPRQRFTFIGIFRNDAGEWKPLTEDDRLDDVDEYSWIDGETLRWRARMPSDPPFANTQIRYLIRYELSNILLEDGNRYVLDHDFLFADREGVIRRFDLQLALDDAWQTDGSFRDRYSASDIAPGKGYVVTLPLTYTGASVPATLDTSRPRAIRLAVLAVLGVTALAFIGVFVRETRRGRFAPLPAVDEPWLRDQVLAYPAEVVGAAWDESVGSHEVMALIARMVNEGKLESQVGKSAVMTLRLKVDRNALAAHERTLVDRLFFNNRTTTNTQLVKQHYRKQGFNPADVIAPELKAAVDATIPEGQRPSPLRYATRILLIIGLGLLVADWSAGRLPTPALFLLGIGSLVLVGIGITTGTQFRAHMDWGRRAALWCSLPAVLFAAAVALFLWRWVGIGDVAASTLLVLALVLLSLGVVSACANAMMSRQRAAGVAFRKRLAAARAFFISELAKPVPALRDEWFPWLLALGLGKQMDDWSAQQEGSPRSSRSGTWSPSSSSSSSDSSSSSSPSWTGFGGGRSGGGGGGAAWTAAASGMAAGVSPPSSSGSGGGSSSSSSSSSGGSSGGGGGGGW